MHYVLRVEALAWQLSETQPQQWPEWLRACGGNVFHTPAGRLVDAPFGTPLYGWCTAPDGTVAGIALGSQSRCKLAIKARHLHFPTLPALTQGVDPGHAILALRDRVTRMGFAEVAFNSFDTQYIVPNETPTRLEYIVPLPSSGDVTAQLSATHRRHLRRGDHEGWAYRLLTGADAVAAVLGVQESTAQRATALQRGFAPAQSTAWGEALVPSVASADTPYGLIVAGAYRDDTLLSSILVGWGGDRAFYLIGGSTPDGYRRGAAVWLHCRTMQMLAAHGIRSYNLGGTPLDAASESSAAHGLYRFKTGFGVQPIEQRCVQWEIRPTHVKLHALVTRLLRRDP